MTRGDLGGTLAFWIPHLNVGNFNNLRIKGRQVEG
jgi:hypothetical protein